MRGDVWPQSWSHNDEKRRRPLLDALAHGCRWIEPDVWVVGDQVLVGHRRPDPRVTLAGAYLDPLRARHDTLGERYLVLDVKSSAQRSLPVIERTLAAYDDVLTHHDADGVVRRPVTVLLSGTLANGAAMRTDSVALTYDGRIGRLPAGADPEWMPLVSASWREHFRWLGAGPVPRADRRRLAELVEHVHDAGLRLRFWSVPDWVPWRRHRLWSLLLDAGVDVITTDHPAALDRLLRQRHQDVSRGRPSS